MKNDPGLFIRDITFNINHFTQLHIRWLELGQEHSGIIVSEQLPVGETVRRLLNFLNTITVDEMSNQLVWLQTFK